MLFCTWKGSSSKSMTRHESLDVAGRNWFKTTFSKMKNTFYLVLAARFDHGYISQKHFPS